MSVLRTEPTPALDAMAFVDSDEHQVRLELVLASQSLALEMTTGIEDHLWRSRNGPARSRVGPKSVSAGPKLKLIKGPETDPTRVEDVGWYYAYFDDLLYYEIGRPNKIRSGPTGPEDRSGRQILLDWPDRWKLSGPPGPTRSGQVGLGPGSGRAGQISPGPGPPGTGHPCREAQTIH